MFLRGLWDVSLNGDLIEISERHLMPAEIFLKLRTERTAFVVGDRNFEWLRMPFGLHWASFSPTAATVEILSDCRSFARAYYDCIVASRGREQHLQHLEKIFQKFSSYCLHINLLKNQIMKGNVIFLGHIVSNKAIFPEASKVDEVVNFFTPSCCFGRKIIFRHGDLL